MSSRELNLLRDLLPSLLERGRQAAAEARTLNPSDPNRIFERGRAQAYYEVLSGVVSQLDAFGVDRDAVGIGENVDLEGDLLIG